MMTDEEPKALLLLLALATTLYLFAWLVTKPLTEREVLDSGPIEEALVSLPGSS
jgi:hypothetical protein